MKDALTKLLTAGKGRAVSIATGLAAAAVTKLATRYGWQLDESISIQISTAAGLVVGWLIDMYALKLSSRGVAKMQEAVQPHAGEVRTDGVPGPVTVAAVQQLADNANTEYSVSQLALVALLRARGVLHAEDLDGYLERIRVAARREGYAAGMEAAQSVDEDEPVT